MKQHLKQKHILSAAGAVTLASLLSTAAPAWADPVPSAGTVLNANRPATDTAPKPADGLIDNKANPAKPATSGAVAGPSIHVTAFHFVGNTAYSEAVLQALLNDFTGQDLTLDRINEAAETIKNHYRDQRYFLAQVFVPKQSVKDGMITLQVMEGAVGQVTVKVDKDARLAPQVAQGYFDNLLPAGTLITETGLEKPLLLVNDLPGVVVHSTLKPGTAPGTADLDIGIGDEGRLVSGYVQLDNKGSAESGRNRLTAGVDVRDLTGYGDLLSISGLEATDNNTALGQINYSIPVGYSGAKVSASYLALRYRLVGAFANLNADGDARVLGLSAQYPLARSRNFNLFALAGFQDKDLNDRRNNGLSLDQHKISEGDVGLIGDSRDDLLGGGLNSFASNLFVGRNDYAVGIANDAYQTNGTFEKFTLDYRRLQNVISNTSVLFSLSGQVANKNLTAAEKLAIGGPNGVRSYPTGEAAGDDAVIGSLELRQVVPQLGYDGAAFQLLAFFDYGLSQLNRTPLITDTVTRRTLRAGGLGLNMAKRDDYVIRVEWASTLGGPPALSDPSASRIWATLTKYF